MSAETPADTVIEQAAKAGEEAFWQAYPAAIRESMSSRDPKGVSREDSARAKKIGENHRILAIISVLAESNVLEDPYVAAGWPVVNPARYDELKRAEAERERLRTANADLAEMLGQQGDEKIREWNRAERAEAERDHYHARLDALLATMGETLEEGEKPGAYWAKWHMKHCAAAEAAQQLTAERDAAKEAAALAEKDRRAYHRDALAAIKERDELRATVQGLADEWEREARQIAGPHASGVLREQDAIRAERWSALDGGGQQ